NALGNCFCCWLRPLWIGCGGVLSARVLDLIGSAGMMGCGWAVYALLAASRHPTPVGTIVPSSHSRAGLRASCLIVGVVSCGAVWASSRVGTGPVVAGADSRKM